MGAPVAQLAVRGTDALSDRRPIIVVAEKYADDALARLHACGEVMDLVGADPGRLAEAVVEADALLVRSYVQVTADLLSVAARLRVVGRGGIGLDNIDLAAARARGVVVVYTPEASTRCVAEHSLGLMLAVERRLLAGDSAVRDGSFMDYRGRAAFRELGDCTLGIVGMGRIGSTVARMAAEGLGMRVLYNDIREVGPFAFPATPTKKEHLYGASDFVSLHVPLTSRTRGLIDSDALARFRPGSVLINTARGGVVDGKAVADALVQGHLGGVGLDVYEDEPLPADHPLLVAPHVVLSPHVAGRSRPARAAMNAVVEDVVAVLQGKSPRFRAPDDLG